MLKRKAVGMVAETLASSGDVFTRDDDLELVGDAIPFGLKLYESLLDSAPTNKDLLIATCSNFTQYGVAYVETEALVLGEAQHHDEVVHLNARALKLYLRAKGYCQRAMEVRFPGIMQKLLADPVACARQSREEGRAAAVLDGGLVGLGNRPRRRQVRTSSSTCRRCARSRSGRWRSTKRWSKGTLHEMFVSLDSLPRGARRHRRAGAEHFTRGGRAAEGSVAGPVRRAGARRRRAGAGSRRVRKAAADGAGDRPGEGSVVTGSSRSCSSGARARCSIRSTPMFTK